MKDYYKYKSWMSVSSNNGLQHVHRLYCKTNEDYVDIDKTARDVFVTGTLQDIREQFQVT